MGGTVLCRIGGAEMRSELCDMSIRGCKLTGVSGEWQEGAQVDLTLLAGIETAGIVRWAVDGAVGVEFAQDINMAAVRYFTLGSGGAYVNDAPNDSFGRKLPTLDRLDSLGIAPA
ncbi:PilZ domain-containing protein [Qipengyuania sp. GH29]|nr:PilZ domain-containing protein [Qipengyuania sphaerica]